MRKNMMFAGIAMLVFEVIGVSMFALLAFVHWTPELITLIAGGAIALIFNLAAALFIIGGAFSDDE